MGFAIVRLRWSPDQFWRSTPHELWAAVEFLEDQAESTSS
jgi:hypothetical protein